MQNQKNLDEMDIQDIDIKPKEEFFKVEKDKSDIVKDYVDKFNEHPGTKANNLQLVNKSTFIFLIIFSSVIVLILIAALIGGFIFLNKYTDKDYSTSVPVYADHNSTTNNEFYNNYSISPPAVTVPINNSYSVVTRVEIPKSDIENMTKEIVKQILDNVTSINQSIKNANFTLNFNGSVFNCTI